MKKCVIILLCLLATWFRPVSAQSPLQPIYLYGDTISLPIDESVQVALQQLSDTTVQVFYQQLESAHYQPLITALLAYKEKHQLSDWLYYQLIRKTAATICPKQENYHRYTLYKWFLLAHSGYDAVVRLLGNSKLLFYVQSNDAVYNIPYCTSNGRQYVCLNYHDYGSIDFEKETAYQNFIHIPGATQAFSYKVQQLPSFDKQLYIQKELRFAYRNKEYIFNVRINPVMKDIFANYPVVDFASCFNIPLSGETYTSLIDGLKESMKNMDEKTGIDYLMHFTRYAFPFEKDKEAFGGEKRLSPEETLLYDHSDCEDRAALFFYLVKEIYNLPMITLLYPEHVTIAIELPGVAASRNTIAYKGHNYTVCEPTPQAEDLKMGQLPHGLKKQNYDIGYEYIPVKN